MAAAMQRRCEFISKLSVYTGSFMGAHDSAYSGMHRSARSFPNAA